MLLGGCWPFLDQRLAPAEAWHLFNDLGAQCIRICSNAAREDVAALLQHYPGLRWVVRTRDPKINEQGQPFGPGPIRPGLLWYRAWASEPTLHDTLAQLLGSGCAVDVELWNEPDIEWDEAASWGPAEAWQRAASDCRQFLEWQLGEIRRVFPDQPRLRLVGPALSEGWPERHQVWLDILDPFYRQCDAIAVHAYTNGRPFDDPDWGGRPLIYRQRFPEKPLLLTEVNDNGYAGTADPARRGAEVGQYLAWLGPRQAVELACLFALPGQREGAQDWWPWSPEMVAALEGQFG